MCRLLAYLGRSIQPNALIYAPEHSLEIQSYRPKETVTTSVNADGVGLGWYDSQPNTTPFIYKNIFPIWADINLPDLSRYIRTNCFLSHIRSATPGQATSLNNCQPFSYGQLLFIHNGFIENFHNTLYRPIRKRLTDSVYRSIEGTTDSEHIFALLADTLVVSDNRLNHSLEAVLKILAELATSENIVVSANLVISNGQQLVACRFARGMTAPSLYWLTNDPSFPESVIVASEPLFPGHWEAFPENSILCVDETYTTKMYAVQI